MTRSVGTWSKGNKKGAGRFMYETWAKVMITRLRFFLVFSAIVWGVAVVGVFVPWSNASTMLQGLGARPIAYDPMLDYWLRMAASAFTFIGGLFAVAAIRPEKYQSMIPWLGMIMIIEALILLTHGLRLGLPLLPFCADVTACFVGGEGYSGIRKAQNNVANKQPRQIAIHDLAKSVIV